MTTSISSDVKIKKDKREEKKKITEGETHIKSKKEERKMDKRGQKKKRARKGYKLPS